MRNRKKTNDKQKKILKLIKPRYKKNILKDDPKFFFLNSETSVQKVNEMYDSYSKILIDWKLEPIALIIAAVTYQDTYSAWKVYVLITVLIHMPVVIFRAYKKTKQKHK